MLKLTHHSAAWLALGAVILATALAYWPGLRGGFFFDDFANLPALGRTGPVTHWDTFWRYVTSGTADPTGRPLALLSFLIDARNWPANPWPFKRTNLLLHLINGVLLFLLLRRLGQRLINTSQNAWRSDLAAALGAGLWLAHPLLVSTTLYIVQREAMLPATFTLLGLLAWLGGRAEMWHGKSASGAIWISLGLVGCTSLATLSKANGALLPPLALVLEYTILRRPSPDNAVSSPPRTYVRAMAILAWLPSLLIASYLLFVGWKGVTVGISDVRPWTLSQRLLTEPRVLLTYLHMLWAPTPFTAGLFNDQLKASSSLLTPWTTLPCLAGVVLLIIGAWKLRARWPALAAAVLFYFVGQSIESSSIPLELFFEHRNYLPAMLMFWPVARWLCDATSATHIESYRGPQQRLSTGAPSVSRPKRNAKGILALLALMVVLGMTWSRATLWGNAQDQALLWAKLNPGSARAQAYAAQSEIAAGHPGRAVRRLEPALAREPDELQLALNLLAARCATGGLDARTLQSAKRALSTSRDSGSLLANWFRRAINQAQTHQCPGLDLQSIDNLLVAAKQNPNLATNEGRQQDIDYLRGTIAIRQDRPNRALKLFNDGLADQPRAGLALVQAAELGANGFPAQGLAHLDYFDRLPHNSPQPQWNMQGLHTWVLARQDYWGREMSRLRSTLESDLKARQTSKR